MRLAVIQKEIRWRYPVDLRGCRAKERKAKGNKRLAPHHAVQPLPSLRGFSESMTGPVCQGSWVLCRAHIVKCLALDVDGQGDWRVNPTLAMWCKV